MQRLTFRDKATDVAWQKQLRDNYNADGVPPVPHLDLKRAVVKPVSRKLAEQIILKYEWLGTMASTNYHYGIFFGMFCAGVCCVGLACGGANVAAHMEWGIDRHELAYLARGANVHWSPPGANSKLVSMTCRLLAKQTSAKLMIAYSDTDAGEIGTIYQACNWTCVGRGSSIDEWVSPTGRIYNSNRPWRLKAAQGNCATAYEYKQMMLRDGWTQQKSNPKYRYVYLLDKKDKRLAGLIESKKHPYPKR